MQKSSFDLEQIDRHLAHFSYLSGYTPTRLDIDIFNDLGQDIDFLTYKYIKRWWYHMRSFNVSEIRLFPESCSQNALTILQKPNAKLIDEQVCSIAL